MHLSRHIIRTGTDAEIGGLYKNSRPSTVRVTDLNPVPGAPAEARNLFDVSQALAWLARQRTDLREQLRWRDQIPGLMGNLRL